MVGFVVICLETSSDKKKEKKRHISILIDIRTCLLIRLLSNYISLHSSFVYIRISSILSILDREKIILMSEHLDLSFKILRYCWNLISFLILL